ncbi:MAG: MFS transporter [Chloroflexi bacterium]|nr:MFS transporter [Chloroflexota bacterium]
MTVEVPAGHARLARARPRFYFGWWLVGAALLAQFVAAGMQAFIVGVFMVPMTTDLGWTRADFTLGLTVGQFVMGIVGMFVGARIDQHRARPLMLVGVTVLGITALGISMVQELWQWLVLRGLLLTIGSALLGGLVVNVTLSKWSVERRGRAIGFAAIGISLAGVVLPPLLTPVVDEFGWRAGWRMLAVGA